MKRLLLPLLIILPLFLFLGGCEKVKEVLGVGAKVIKVEIGAGKATITDREDDGLSHVKIECNNGLVIDADWKRNSYSDFGYDIYEPTVSETYNKLSIMIIARRVIANYLNGEYE